MSESYDHLFIVVLVGDASVGKTSLLRRYAEESFVEHCASTKGFEFRNKSIELESKTLKLQIWDTAGDERFRMMGQSYYRGAHGIVLCYDVTRRSSLENLSVYLKGIRKHANEHVNLAIFGNQCDNCTGREVSVEEGQAFAESLGIPFSETSARDDFNVQAAFEGLAAAMLERIAPRPVVFTLVSVTATNSSVQLSVAKLSGQTLDLNLIGSNPSVEAANLAIAEACGLPPKEIKLVTLDGTLVDGSGYLDVSGGPVDVAGSSLRCTIQ